MSSSKDKKQISPVIIAFALYISKKYAKSPICQCNLVEKYEQSIMEILKKKEMDDYSIKEGLRLFKINKGEYKKTRIQGTTMFCYFLDPSVDVDAALAKFYQGLSPNIADAFTDWDSLSILLGANTPMLVDDIWRFANEHRQLPVGLVRVKTK